MLHKDNDSSIPDEDKRYVLWCLDNTVSDKSMIYAGVYKTLDGAEKAASMTITESGVSMTKIVIAHKDKILSSSPKL